MNTSPNQYVYVAWASDPNKLGRVFAVKACSKITAIHLYREQCPVDLQNEQVNITLYENTGKTIQMTFTELLGYS